MRRIALALITVALTATMGLAYDDIGENPLAPTVETDSPTLHRDCSILYFYASSDDYSRIQNLGYNVTATTNASDLVLDNLVNYDVLIMYLIHPGTVGAYQADIESFVSVGGALFIHQPNGVGVVDYAPAGFEATISGVGYDDYEPCLLDTSHPITTGMTNADLPGVYDIVASIGAGYTLVLAENCTFQFPALALGEYGNGVVVFDVSNLNQSTWHPPSDQFIIQLMDFLCEHGTVATQQESWSGIKGIFE